VVKLINQNQYEITLEYNFGLNPEVWRTSNLFAKDFYRSFEDNSGVPHIQVCAPPCLNNPGVKCEIKELLKFKLQENTSQNEVGIVDEMGKVIWLPSKKNLKEN
jgi:hypothetical protein